MMKRQRGAALCAILMICAVLTGCGKNKDEEPAAEAPAEIYAPTPEPVLTIYPKTVAEDLNSLAESGTSFTAYNGAWTLTLPDNWSGLWGARDGDYAVRFVDIANAGAGYGGLLFILLYVQNGTDYDYLPDYVLLGSDDSGSYVAYFPTDVQYDWTDPSLTAEYESMTASLRDWLPGHFALNN